MIKFLRLLILLLPISEIKAELKKTVLWSWERYEDLSYIDPKVTSVAPLIATFIINKDEKVKAKLRLNHYKIPIKTNILPVFRIEIETANLNYATIYKLVLKILSLSKENQLIQLDFDARLSQRTLYRDIINLLVKHKREVSITALASFCTFDSWLDNLPIKFAVPMLYGGEAKDKGLREAKILFEKLGVWPVKKCRGYVGILQQNEKINIPNNHASFIFNNSAWNRNQYMDVIKYE